VRGLLMMTEQLLLRLNELLASPVFLTGLSCLVYSAAKKLYERRQWSVLHPVLITTAALIAFLQAVKIDYSTYHTGTAMIRFLLDVSVVALALPLYRQFAVLRKNRLAILLAVVAGGTTGIVTALLPFLITGGAYKTAVSAAPSSITTPVAMAVSESAGGIPALTAAIVVITGILGAVIGPYCLIFFRVKNPVAFGLAMGTAAHGIGTARALQEGELCGAGASLGLCLNTVVTAVAVPIILKLMF